MFFPRHAAASDLTPPPPIQASLSNFCAGKRRPCCSKTVFVIKGDRKLSNWTHGQTLRTAPALDAVVPRQLPAIAVGARLSS